MTVRYYHVEFMILFGALALAFLYFPIRAVVLDTFVWVTIFPMLGALYVAAVARRYTRFRLNTLDWVMVVYTLYGLLGFGAGLLFLDAPLTSEVRIIVHFYLPVILYIVARRYTLQSIDHVAVILRLIMLIAALLVIDFAVEYYIVIIQGEGARIPWVARYIDELAFINPDAGHQYGSEQVLSILRGGKKPGMTAAVLFAAILPFLYLQRQDAVGARWARSWSFNRVMVGALPLGLALIAFQTANDTAALAAGAAAVMAVMAIRSVRSAAAATIFFAIGFVLFASQFNGIIQAQFINKSFHTPDGSISAFQYTTDPKGIIRTLSTPSAQTLVLGAHLTGEQGGWAASGPSGVQGYTELRAVLFPVYFGVGWMVIAIIGLATAIRFAFQAARAPSVRWFGVSLLGVLFVIAGDLHYPSGMQHGPYEILLILLGALSSLHESTQKQAIVLPMTAHAS